MNITELLDRPIAYHRVFVTLTGSVKAAILLSQAMYWQKRATQADGWWYKTAEEWQEETGLSKHEQDTARRDCGRYLKTDLRGVPATLYWKVDEEELENALIQFSGKRKTRIAKSGKQVSRKQQNINKNTENTAETTTENTTNKSATPKVTDFPELVLYREVVSHWCKPHQKELVISAVQKINTRLNRSAIADDLKPFFQAWARVSGNDWSLVWLDWAVSGVIPQQGRPQPANEPKAFDGIRSWLNSVQPEEVISVNAE